MTLPFLSDCILKTQRCDTKCTNCFLQRPLLCGCRHLQLISCVLINEQISEILKTKQLDDKLDISKYSRLERQTFLQTRYVMWTFVCYSLCICGYTWVWSMEVFHERTSERFTDVHVPTCFFLFLSSSTEAWEFTSYLQEDLKPNRNELFCLQMFVSERNRLVFHILFLRQSPSPHWSEMTCIAVADLC